MLKRGLILLAVLSLAISLCSCGTDEKPVLTDSPVPEATMDPGLISSVMTEIGDMKTLSEMDALEIVSGNFRDYVDSRGIDDTDYIYDDTFDYVQSIPADTSDENLKISFNATQASFETYTTFSIQLTVTGDVAGHSAGVIITDGTGSVEISKDDAINYGTEDTAEYCFEPEILDPENDFFESKYYSDIVKIFASGNEITVTVVGENATNVGTLSDTARKDFEYINDIYAFNRKQYLK